MTPYVVIPVHNRQAMTVRCLQNLDRQGVLSWARVVVVDDGSSDGTGERVRRDYPQVFVLRGDGTLWWAGAMEQGMRRAMDEGAAQVFWLNDDCYPKSGTLEALRDYAVAHRCIAVGQAVTPAGFRYGGFRKTMTWFVRLACDQGGVVTCDTFNGNCVCIPREVVEAIGYPDACVLPHALADTDYGLRAGKAGFQAVVIGQALCDNEENPSSRSWLREDVPLREIWRCMTTPKGLYYVPAYFRFCLRHWGAWGLVVSSIPYVKTLGIVLLRLVLPRGVRRSWFGGRLRQGAP
jgi:GT2 family glycosyltransferase